jgi:8-oxo-dGTP diphosphatase
MSLNERPVFGEREPGREYLDRPGAYGLLFDDAGRIALVQTAKGFFLPGGALELGETPEAGLRRELREETGLEAGALVPLAQATDYFEVEPGGPCYCVRSVFLKGKVLGQAGEKCEADHELVWRRPEEAAGLLLRPSQRWVVGEV